MKVLTSVLTNEIRKIITLFFFKSVIPKEQNATSYMFENTTILKILFILDKTLTPQSMDYPRGLSRWTTQKWTTLLKIND